MEARSLHIQATELHQRQTAGVAGSRALAGGLALPTCCVLTAPKYRAEKDRKCYPSAGNKPLGRCTDEAPAVFQKNTELPV